MVMIPRYQPCLKFEVDMYEVLSSLDMVVPVVILRRRR